MEQDTVHTRPSLLRGIQGGNEDRWQQFYRVYAPVIRGFAIKAGLTETEADEVVQETCIGVARNVGEFRYNPRKCRFKTWLLNLASWRVKSQFTKRQRWDERVHGRAAPARSSASSAQEETRTATIERVPDLGADHLDAIWDQEWRGSLLKAAIDRVRSQFSATQFQIFDLNVVKEWSAADVAKSLGVSLATVYLAKHRVSAAVKKEIRRVERSTDPGRIKTDS
jgi:RNA polymerase sigma factor (sigma-70 family)